jgi:hypothetical protein
MARRHLIAAWIFALTNVFAFTGLSAPAHAAPVPPPDPSLIAFQLTTTIDTTSVGGGPDTPMRIIYRFNPTLAPGSGGNLSETAADYGPLERVIVEVGDQCAAMSGPGTSIAVFNNAGTTVVEDSYAVTASTPFGSPRPPKLFGLDIKLVQFVLVDNERTMFSNTSLPTTFAFGDQADAVQLTLLLFNPTTQRVVSLIESDAPFQLSPYFVQVPVEALRDALSELTLSTGVRNALNGPLDKAIGYLNTFTRDSLQKAAKEFELFIKQVEAHRNKGIDTTTADGLIAFTRQVTADILPKCA